MDVICCVPVRTFRGCTARRKGVCNRSGSQLAFSLDFLHGAVSFLLTWSYLVLQYLVLPLSPHFNFRRDTESSLAIVKFASFIHLGFRTQTHTHTPDVVYGATVAVMLEYQNYEARLSWYRRDSICKPIQMLDLYFIIGYYR